MSDRPAHGTREVRPPRGFFALAAFAGLAAAMLFVGFPYIDFAVSDLFFGVYGGKQNFAFRVPGIGPTMRTGFTLLFAAACVAFVLGLLITGVLRRPILGLGFRHWLYLALCMALGPGLVANTLLKDNWGRARPVHVEEYGGDRMFTPALAISDQCESNCSFVAGEASSIYMLFFALALAVPAWRRRFILAALVLGTAAGAVRIGAGGHFFSDVVFAGVFMALVARALYWAVMENGWAASLGRRWRGDNAASQGPASQDMKGHREG